MYMPINTHEVMAVDYPGGVGGGGNLLFVSVAVLGMKNEIIVARVGCCVYRSFTCQRV